MTQALTLLIMALQLLVAVNKPNVPESLKQSAISTANLAIQIAQKALKEPVTTPVPEIVKESPTIPEPKIEPKPESIKEYPFEVIPIKTSNTFLTNQVGYSINIPSIFLGSFKVRTNPNTEIRWYDCNVSLSEPYSRNWVRDTINEKTRFGSYKLAGFVGGGENNCFINTSFTKTDKDGFTEEIGLYINDLYFSTINNSSSIRKFKFYLNDITIREVATDDFHRATSSLIFDLDISRY